MENHGILKRAVSFLLFAIISLQLLFTSALSVFAADATSINLSALSTDVHLFTNLRFLAGSATVETGAGSYLLSGNADSFTVFVGNETYEGNRYQSTENISVTLSAANIATLVLNPVGENENKTIAIAVTSTSVLSNVTIAANTNVTIAASAALNLETVTMGDGSSLTITANGSSVSITSLTGTGDLTLAGDCFSMGTISAKNVAITSGSCTGISTAATLTATDAMSLTDADISTFQLVGYTSSSTGAKTISVSGTTGFTDVTDVGASENCTANITIDGTCTLTNSNAIEDFTLSYYNGTDEIAAESSWPVSYRVRFVNGLDASSATTIGYHEASGDYVSGSVELPKYSVTGYGYAGWMLNGSSTAVTFLPSGIRDSRTLTVKMEAGTVSVTYDLKFTPSETTCDDWETTTQKTTFTANLGDSLTLPTPTRFGYRFTGWKVVTGSVHNTYEGTYSIALTDADTTDGYSVELEAQWEALYFPFKLFVTGIDVTNVGVIANGVNYSSLAAFASSNSHITWSEGDSMLQFDENIAYGESLNSFFLRLGITGNIELYDKTTGTSKQDFLGWSDQIGSNVTLDSTYAIDSLFEKPDNLTLSAYQTQLMNTPVFITSEWGTASYTVTTTVNSDWEFVVGGVVQSLEADANGNATITVAYGTELIWRYRSTKTENFSFWRFTSTTDSFVTPSETTYSSSNAYISFKTTMPEGNVIAVYSDPSETPIYFDLSCGSITFEDSVTENPSGRSVSGFWCSFDMAASAVHSYTGSTGNTIKVNSLTPLFYNASKGYFYEWGESASYFTTRETETQNQLTLIKGSTIYLQYCNMVATTYYSNNLKINSGLSSSTTTEYTFANIILDNTKTISYTTNIYVIGYNVVACIGQKIFSGNNTYTGKTYIRAVGTAAELNSALIYGFMHIYMYGLTYSRYVNATYPDNYYRAHFGVYGDYGAEFQFYGCDIQMAGKKFGATKYYRFYKYGTTLTKATVDAIEANYGIIVAENSEVYIAKDMTGGHQAISVYSGGKLVVGGNITKNWSHQSSYDKIDGTGSMVVVEGAYYDAGILVMSGGTLIANAVCVGRYVNMSGGTIIANQIANHFRSMNATTKITANGDNSYFDQYWQNSNSSGSFSVYGTAKIFLFGTYTPTSGTTYNFSYTAQTDGNPLKAIEDSVLDDVKQRIIGTVDTASVKSSVLSQTTSYDCFLWGNSTKNVSTESQYRSVKIYGTAEIYASGALTFNNDTEISGNAVVTSNQMIASKNTLTIQGGTVTAPEVGNSHYITHDVSGALRWSLLEISAGTICTDRLGAVSRQYNSSDSKSTIVLTGTTATVVPMTESSVAIVDDIYVNYFYDDTVFKNTNTVYTLRFKGTANGSLSLLTGLQMNSNQIFASPILLEDNSEQVWRLGSLNGEIIASVAADGSVNSGTPVYQTETYLALYAAKDAYILYLKAGNCDSQTTDGNYFLFNNGEARISADSNVVLYLESAEDLSNTVVWYYDAANLLHNTMPVFQNAGSTWTVSFTMPSADTEIWITDKLNLYLDVYNIAVTEDGFGVEPYAVDRRSDSLFTYAGSLNIGMKTPSVPTTNRVYFEDDSGNLLDNGSVTREIIYDTLYQNISADLPGTQINNVAGNKIRITINGLNRIAPILCDQNVTLELIGESDSSQDQVAFFETVTSGYKCIYSNGQIGTVTLKNLAFLNNNSTYYNTYGMGHLVYSSSLSSNLVTYENCDIQGTSWGSSSSIVRSVKNVVMKNCTIQCLGNQGYNTPPFNGCTNVTLEGCTVTHRFGGSSFSCYPFFGTVTNMTVRNSTVTTTTNRNTSSNLNEVYSLSVNLVLDNTTWTHDYRLILKKLTLTNDSVLTVSNASGSDYNGYLLCPDISVSSGSTINAGYVIVSGFNNTSVADETEFGTMVMTASKLVDGSSYNGIVIDGGTVNATEFVGGDINGKVTVNNGELNAKNIGTCGSYFGYPIVIPSTSSGKEMVCQISDTPTNCTVTVTGGKVTVLENGVLGGINSIVNLNGGTVKLSDNSYIGISENQQQTAETNALATGINVVNPSVVTINGCSVAADGTTGSINAPYSTLVISGTDTSINVDSVEADNGTIKISDAATGAGENPYTGQENRKPAKVGIITQSMQAGVIEITDSASVYASSITTTGDGTDSASLIVESGFLSTDGGFSEAVHTGALRFVATANADDQTVFGLKMVAITYELDKQGILFSDDVAKIVNSNITSYAVTSTAQTVTINDAVCAGYYFRGWYTDEEMTISAGSTFNTSLANDITLYAKWEKVTVKLAVVIDTTSTSVDLSTECSGSSWSSNGDGSYTSTVFVYVTYGERVISSTGVSYSNYNTNKFGVTQFEYFKVQSGQVIGGSTSISQTTTLSSEIAEIYKTISSNGTNPDAVVKLHVASLQNLFATLKLLLNQQNSKPADAKFDSSSGSYLEYSISIDAQVKTVNTFAGTGTTRSPDLVTASATGYTFLGWNTNSAATSETTTGWITGDSYIEESTVAYAIWQANTYRIRFSTTDGQWITAHNIRPAYNSAHQTSVDYYWVYDTPITEENSFWLINENTLEALTELPFAWKEGYTFDQSSGWSYSYTDGTGRTVTETISSTSALSKVVVKSIDTEVSDPSTQHPETPAITFNASYIKATITYNLNGGIWTNNLTDTEQLDYSRALRGMTQTSYADAGNELIGTQITEEDQLYYNVQSTTAAYFAANSAYTASDYRNSLSKKGYTFYGWYTSEDAANNPAASSSDAYKVGSSPRFEDLQVYAGWVANSYSLDLYSFDTQFDYVTYHVAKENYITGISVTVGESISSSSWPSRNGDWYAFNSGDDSSDDNKKRFLLGFTFVGLNPGNSNQDSAGYSDYLTYAQVITNLENASALFMNEEKNASNVVLVEGTVFSLPEDAAYTEAIQSDTTVTIPDYPNGSTIKMYATYRERSLVFEERYIDPDGVVQKKICFSGAWNQWSNFVDDTYGTGNSEIISQGYSLEGWHINGTTSTATRYPTIQDNGTKEAATALYEANMATYKNNAQALGTYDIVVYTVYVAQVENTFSLDASENPTSTAEIVNSYTLPASMQKGVLSFETTLNNGLKLVPKSEMELHAYDSSWTNGAVTYSADNTVAVTATIQYAGVSYTYDLSSGTVDTGKMVSSGWTVELRLYHSKVMTADSELSLTVKMLFNDASLNGTNSLGDQFVKDNITVGITPSVYTVRCTVELPEQYSNLTLTAFGDFSGTYQATDLEMTKEFTRDYGSAVDVEKPDITGYTAESDWLYSDNLTYANVTMPVTAANNGVILVRSSYTAKTYSLTVSNDVLSKWIVTYTDGANGASDITYTSQTDVKYHSVMKFTERSSAEVPQFVLCNDEKLDEISTTSDNAVWTYLFGDADENVIFCNIQKLYLENGTIDISASGYTQNGTTKIWPGHYVIWQNESNSASTATENVLNLTGDLSSQSISLGNLNISSGNSICLDNAKASLTETGTLSAKNILVPYDSSLSLTGSGDSSKVILTPAVGKAGIGGDVTTTENGKISLDHLEIDVTLTAGSSASGIGSGTQDVTRSSQPITVSNCTVKMKETAGTSAYTGSWIGGNGVEQVVLSNTVVERLDNSTNHTAGPNTVCGKVVSITDSKIGTSASDSVYNPIYAENSLTIQNSEVYMTIQDNLGNNAVSKSPIGTSDTGVMRTDSVIQVTKAGNGAFAELYTGLLLITSENADIVISDNQIMETTLGDITVTDQSVTQNGVSHDHTGSYVLLQEGTVDSDNPTDLTVNSIADGKTITLVQPTAIADNANAAGNSRVLLGTVALNADVTVNNQADLEIKTGFTGSGNVILNTDGHTVTLDTDAMDSTGSLTVNHGTIASSHDIGGEDMTITLNGVAVTAKNLIAKTLTVDAGSVTATEKIGCGSAGTVRTATFKNGAVISAPSIGAIGTENSSFTFVVIDENVKFTGTVYRDLYRIGYDKSELDLDVSALPVVYRDQETLNNEEFDASRATSSSSILANPTGTDADIFLTWYLFSSDGTNRIAVQDSSFTKPVGISGTALLNYSSLANAYTDDVTANADGTSTLTVHAWAKTTGEAFIVSGRKFLDFSSTAKEVTIENSNAFTVRFTSTGSNIDGRDYYLSFGQNLPVGTALTLVVLKNNGTRDYYYFVVSSETTKVKFSEFAKNGTGNTRISLAVSADDDQFLIGVDFSQSETYLTGNLTVEIGIIPVSDNEIRLSNDVKCSFTEVKDAVLSSSGTQISVSSAPSGKSSLASENVFLKAVLKDSSGNLVSADYDIVAKLGSSTGVLVNRSTLIFALGTYSTVSASFAETLSITGLDAGTYKIQWTMVTGDSERDNVFRNVISNEVTMTYVVGTVSVHGLSDTPWLSASSSKSVPTISVGIEEAVAITYLTSADNITVSVKKMVSINSYQDVTDGTVTYAATTSSYQGTETVTFTENATAGTYVITLSMKDGTDADNVYFTYIVK